MDITPLKYFESLYPPNTREREIREYLDFLKRGLSAQIIGLPGIGKNNLLRLLAFNIEARKYHFKDYERHMHFVYIDSGEAKNKSNFEITKLMFSSLLFSLEERRLTDEITRIKSLFTEGVMLNDEFLLFQYLKKAIEYLTIERKLSVILLFDRFDLLAPNLTEEFFTNLKSLRDTAKYRFGVIFSLVRPLEDTVDINLISDFSDIVFKNEIFVSLSDQVAIDFRTHYIEKMARHELEKDMRDKILLLTGGHAKLTKVAFEKAVNETEKIEDIRSYLLDLPNIQKALGEIWNALLPAEKSALKQNMKFDEIESQYPYLVKVGLVDKNGVTIPLFKDFLENVDLSNDENISYDESKNEILKGDTTITSLLSSSEFRLLRFMLENRDKVVTKDEIISAVWSDTKTQEGVTDQALDQIFYRLRKKIESDPKNPRLIKTVKGTGYKLDGR